MNAASSDFFSTPSNLVITDEYLLPVNTYADPGFQGNLGIILHNNSINYLKIKEDELIAKIEFSALQHPVQKRYNGQHGYKTKIWPIPVEYSLTNDEIKSDNKN